MNTVIKNVVVISLLCFLIFKTCEKEGFINCDYLYTEKIDENLYAEYYQTFSAGVYGEVVSCFLTDSISFRCKVGSNDEHGRTYLSKKGEYIYINNCETKTIYDTVEKVSITETEFGEKSKEQKDCDFPKPIFGKNILKCKNGIDTSSWKTDKEINFRKIQFKCDNQYLDALYFINKKNESIFVGIYIPGSLENNYDYDIDSNGRTIFYRVNYIRKLDTVKTEKKLLSELKNTGMNNVCK